MCPRALLSPCLLNLPILIFSFTHKGCSWILEEFGAYGVGNVAYLNSVHFSAHVECGSAAAGKAGRHQRRGSIAGTGSWELGTGRWDWEMGDGAGTGSGDGSWDWMMGDGNWKLGVGTATVSSPPRALAAL